MVRSDGRNDAALAAALEAMAQAMQNQPNVDENAGTRSLATFQRERTRQCSKAGMILMEL